MKAFIIAFLLVTGASICEAQVTPQVDTRQYGQRARIRNGLATGELNRPEAHRLRREQRHIRRVERRAKADGHVSGRERMKLHRKQKMASRHIRKERID